LAVLIFIGCIDGSFVGVELIGGVDVGSDAVSSKLLPKLIIQHVPYNTDLYHGRVQHFLDMDAWGYRLYCISTNYRIELMYSRTCSNSYS
jgi:hypothetical protein